MARSRKAVRWASNVPQSDTNSSHHSESSDVSEVNVARRPRGRPLKAGSVTKSTRYRRGFKQKHGKWFRPPANEDPVQTKFTEFPKPPSCRISRTTMKYRMLKPIAPDEVVEFLGSGYDKDISLRYALEDGQKVAFAEMNMEGSEEEKRQRLIRLRNEFRLCSFVNTRTNKVVHVREYSEIDGRRGKQAVWLMDCADMSLSRFAYRARRANASRMLTRQQARTILRSTAEALADLHDRCQILHRDVKGGNFLVFEGNLIRLADLGFSTTSTPPLTGRYGTKRFFAPEMLRWGQHDQSVDVFAYSRMAIELSVGYPFTLDANRFKQGNGGAERWQTSNRKEKKLLIAEVDDYIEWLTMAGVAPLELSKMARSDLRGFAVLLEDIGRYWARERLSFRNILDSPLMLDPRNGIEVICLTVDEIKRTATIDLLVNAKQTDVLLELKQDEPTAINTALESITAKVGRKFDMPTMRQFLQSSYNSAQDILRARAFRRYRDPGELGERVAFLNYLQTVSRERKMAIFKSDGLKNRPALPREQVEQIFYELLGEDDSSDDDDDENSEEDSSSPMSFVGEKISSN